MAPRSVISEPPGLYINNRRRRNDRAPVSDAAAAAKPSSTTQPEMSTSRAANAHADTRWRFRAVSSSAAAALLMRLLDRLRPERTSRVVWCSLVQPQPHEPRGKQVIHKLKAHPHPFPREERVCGLIRSRALCERSRSNSAARMPIAEGGLC